MKTRVWAIAVVLWTSSASAWAAPIVLSSDMNILDSLDAQVGNQRLFTNVLGDSTNVVIRHTVPGVTHLGDNLEAFYDSLAGVSATQMATASAAALAGAGLFVGLASDVAYSPAETAALIAFASGGGTIMLFGENAVFDEQNAAVNALLAALGSGMSVLDGPFFDEGFHTATGAQILPHLLSAGVISLQYAAPGLIAGGTPIVVGTGQEPFIAAEGFPSVPEPSSLVLLTTGAIGVLRLRRQRVR